MENIEKRKQINTFLMQWMSGSPTLTIVVVPGIVPSGCSNCLMSFLSGWIKYSLENNPTESSQTSFNSIILERYVYKRALWGQPLNMNILIFNL